MKTVKPCYYDKFSCIAADCPDNCCTGWVIDVPADAMDFYKTLDGKIGEKIFAITKGYKKHCFKTVDRKCPFFTDGGLCEICLEAGVDALKGVCERYPRFINDFGAYRERGLYISCPVASDLLCDAKQILLPITECSEEPVTSYNSIDATFFTSLVSAKETLIKIAASDIPLDNKLYSVLAETAKLHNDFCKGKLNSVTIPEFDRAPFKKLEYLRRSFYSAFSDAPHTDTTLLSNLLIYFIHGYFMKAAYDNDIFGKGAFIVGAIQSILHLATSYGSVKAAAHIFSKEIEHSNKNIQILTRYWRRHYGRKNKL